MTPLGFGQTAFGTDPFGEVVTSSSGWQAFYLNAMVLTPFTLTLINLDQI